MSTANYRALLRTPGAAAFFLPALLGRIGGAMTGLGIVWLVHARTGSFAAAGVVSGGFAVAEAAGAPQLARLADRFGQTRVLPPVLLGHAAAVAALVGLASADAPRPLLALGGAAVGASVPQLPAMSAARWAALLRGGRAAELPAAFALESVGNAVSYLVGPALVSALAAAGHPAAGSALATASTVGGGLLLAARRGSAPPHTADGAVRARAGRTLLSRGLVVLIGLNLGIGVWFGALQVSVTAFAVEHGTPGAAAPLFAVSSGAGLLAGWLYGLRRWRAAPPVQLLAATGVLTLGGLLLLAADSPLALGPAVVVTGAAVAPLLALFTLLAESAVDPLVLTQAFSWLGSASAAGSAVAAGAAGWAVDSLGAGAGFALAVGAAVGMSGVAAVGRGAL